MLYYEDIKVRSKRSGEATSKYTSQALSEPLTRWRAPAPLYYPPFRKSLPSGVILQYLSILYTVTTAGGAVGVSSGTVGGAAVVGCSTVGRAVEVDCGATGRQ